MKVVIHCEPQIAWQLPFARKMARGLHAIGLQNGDVTLTTERQRTDYGIPILLGTTLWRAIEATKPYLLVDRCSFGDTNKYVSLVWDGHGGRGNHMLPIFIPKYPRSRWDEHGVPLKPFLPLSERFGKRHVLCGQVETYSPHWDRVEDWYESAIKERVELKDPFTHFRPHPAVGDNPTSLPTLTTWEDVWFVDVLNSSVGVQALIDGLIPTAHDEGSVIFNWNGPNTAHDVEDRRRQMLETIAWTQWSHEEIEAGLPIKHLFENV